MAWIFGYGSLVYKPGFDFKRKVHGYIKGYRRVWWQGSTDHRGTPESPGRTVTLVEDPKGITWGVAYELAGTDEEQQQYISYLEWREKQYDIRRLCDVHVVNAPSDAAAEEEAAVLETAAVQQQDQPQQQEQPQQQVPDVVPCCLVYIASESPNNKNYLGPAPLQAIAEQIATSHGPSGPNHEYLFKLAAAMRKMQVHDPELFELETLVQQYMASSSSSSPDGAKQQAAVAAAGAVAVAAACAVQQGAAGAVQQTVQLLATAKSQQQQQQQQQHVVVNAVSH